jgi:subfamily B ATP-binding cassette protein MsbA
MTPNPQSDRSMVRALFRDYIAPYKRILLLGMVAMIIMAICTATNAYMMQPVLDDIFVRRDASLLLIIPLILVVVALVNAGADYGQSLALRYVGQRIVASMQADLFAHMMHADLQDFHDHSSGKRISRMTNDIMLLRNAVSTVVTGFVKESISLSFLVALMFYQSWQMSIIGFGILIFAVLPILRLGRRMRKVSGDTQQRLSEFTGQLDETFSAARIVKAYSRENFEIDRVNRTIRDLFKLYYKGARTQALASPMMHALTGIAIAAVIWYGGFQVLNEGTTPGAFFSFLTAMLMAYRPIKVLASLNTQWQEGLAAASRFYDVLSTKPDIVDAVDAKPLQVKNGMVSFDKVGFSYNETAGVGNISFDIAPKTTLALVGPSGSGKTTLTSLLLRFYDTSSGTIFIDGQDIKTITLQSLREQIAFVSQDIVLFDDSVRSNIAYGKLDASEDEIIAAAKMAEADGFIRNMPQGYDTVIGPHGVKLSGGQRQRISIARALLKNAPILVLDEATSSLDTASERSVQHALEHLMKARTTLIIAHRLSTIRAADHIIVLDHGAVVERGTHESLITQNGLYANLHQQQTNHDMP